MPPYAGEMQSSSKLYYCREGQTGIVHYLRLQRVTRGPQKKKDSEVCCETLTDSRKQGEQLTASTLYSKFRSLFSSACTQRGYDLYRPLKELFNRIYFSPCINCKLFTQ